MISRRLANRMTPFMLNQERKVKNGVTQKSLQALKSPSNIFLPRGSPYSGSIEFTYE